MFHEQYYRLSKRSISF